MKKYEEEMIKVLHALDDAKALSSCVIAGSWAMYFYEKVFEDFVARVETTDLDIFLPNAKGASGNNLPEKLRSIQYIIHTDYLSGKTVFVSSDGFNIEFLSTPDRTMSNTIKVNGLSVVAEALPLMAPAGWNYIQIPFESMIVNVASPVSFVLQKLLIHNERNSNYKKEKDAEAIKYVLKFIKASEKYSKELNSSFETYPKKWKKTILQNAKEIGVEL